jgi:hypothetical protein
MLSRRRTAARTPFMPFAPLDLLLTLAPAGLLLMLWRALRVLGRAGLDAEHVAVTEGARAAPVRDRHGEFVPAYTRVDV